jgi:hypothetical protein
VIACLHGVQAAIDLGIMFAVHEADALLLQFGNGKRGGRLVGYGLSDSGAKSISSGRLEMEPRNANSRVVREFSEPTLQRPPIPGPENQFLNGDFFDLFPALYQGRMLRREVA